MECDRAVLDVFPSSAEALLGPQAEVDQDGRHIEEQERIARLNRLLAALGGSDAFERAPMRVQNVLTNGGCGRQVAGLFVCGQHAVPMIWSP